MRSKQHLVYRSNVRQCAACGCNVAWTKTKAGTPYLVEVEFDARQRDWFFRSYGNHHNLRVAHDCIGEQVKRLEQSRFDLERLGEEMEFDGMVDGKISRAAFLERWEEKKETFVRVLKLDVAQLSAQYDRFLDALCDAGERNRRRREAIKDIADREARITEMRAKIDAAKKI